MERLRKRFLRRRPIDTDLETPEEQKERWKSIYIIYFTMFLMSLGFSIILSSIWPYLDSLDPTAGKIFMGYVVAANPFGQMLFSPLIGWWGNKRGSVRLPMLVTLALFVVSSAAYSLVQILPGSPKIWMLTARLGIGISSANIALTRSYLSAATVLAEKIQAVSMVSLAQVLGFAVGPALQAAVTPIGKGFTLLGLPINMYTAPGWLNVIMGIANFVLFLPYFFKERHIATREAMRDLGKVTEKEAWKAYKPDYLGAWSLILAFGILVFNFILLETLGTPLMLDNFAWTKQDTVGAMGIMMSVGAVLACLSFAMIEPLCKKFNERKMLIWAGFFLMIIGRVLIIPWGPGTPRMAELDPITNATSTENGNGTEIIGCPRTQEWCYHTPMMTPLQWFIGYVFTTIGYPIGVTLTQTIFSTILGPRPQGLWMGMLTGTGCASRVLGPVFVGYIYTVWGPYPTFGITGFTLIVGMIWLMCVDKRLIPKVPESKKKTQNGNVEVELPLFGAPENQTNEIEMQNLNENSIHNDK
ncbi:major facilitator superfamily domain-containing protein 8 [Fopius arisanus]|uniref:Major facilitator superfamily domain-containing protein 8 n=1 Tax=Fopius arisanus TaxID=64838 RepID=A0A0C9QXR8_9HYME|nr:PREDICTED: major facilitator superfamily domain-containing protein 8 [Fopius arisanus]XP_011302074.1 PREDICTED: major facilitator superfamily domain-containing protein 8 [Fopius arisanus]XP_011302154.1 PREDICTED: major facilitator superfamily domain-containing protein 8 [Fopius arisanus]XP_011302220.1 PREDICTED: major facilitator superfamily domain-containing protein 8 [Fopius arisanus]XP_011302289.1 PREDICTED: major facilitator superfamily domain-containing protein 8 [Fopius arisanus]XP_01